MRLTQKTLLAVTALSGAMLAPVFAQDYPAPADDATVVVIDQVLLNDVFANMQVTVATDATGADVSALASGNVASGDGGSGDLDFDVNQLQQALVEANVSLTGGPILGGDVTTVSTAYGNSATSTTTNGTTFHTLTQVSDNDVAALTNILLNGADTVNATTTAAANVSTYSAANGTVRGFQRQTGNADVFAYSFADLCCNNNSALVSTSATGNTITSTGTTNTSYNGAVQIMALGTDVYAETELLVQSATSTVGSATAAGNSATVYNEWGFATLGRDGSELYQGNGADVVAVSTVNLDNWSGTSGATAYGVGNSGLISNVGSDTGLFANQENLGDVYAGAAFNGSTSDGSSGYVSSTAFGNALTATLCYTCTSDGILYGSVTQTNSGSITAYGTTTTSGNGFIQGSAIAIGNTATFQKIGTN